MKKVFSLFILLVNVIAAMAQGVSVNIQETDPGQSWVMSVSLQGATRYSAFQFDVLLPDNIGWYNIEKGGLLTDSHNIDTQLQSNGYTRIAVYSMSMDQFNADEGEILRFMLSRNNYVPSGEHQVSLTNIRFSDNDGHENLLVPVEATLTSTNWHTVRFIIDGNVESSDYLPYNAQLTVPTPTRDGYHLSEWTPEITGFMPDYDVDYYSSWQLNTYTITFDSNGGSEVPSVSYYYNDWIYAPSNPSREGYTFIGWEPELPQTMPAYDFAVVAQWQINQYTLSFDSNGGTAVEPITQDYHTYITPPVDPAREGYTFTGWNQPIPEYMPAQNMYFTAQWQINQYTITFNTDGGSEIAPITMDYGSYVGWVSNPSREGYTFIGWDQEIPQYMPAYNMTITALWQINQYTIYYDSNGGSAVAPVTVDYNSVIVPPTDPVREGYTFVGWANLPSNMPAYDIYPVAQWQINNYTVTYVADGVVMQRSVHEYNSYMPGYYGQNPEKRGYDFMGWQAEGFADIPYYVPAQDVVINAVLQIRTHYVNYYVNDELKRSEPYHFGQAITAWDYASEVPGYEFLGWVDLPLVMDDEDVDVYGYSIPYLYFVKFIDMDGSYIDYGLYEYGSVFNVPEVPVHEGYTFSYWDPAIPTDRITPLNGATYTATYSRNAYNVNYRVNGSIVHTVNNLYGDPMPTYEVEDVPGFLEWVSEDEVEYETQPAHDVTYVALFDIDSVDEKTVTSDFIDVYSMNGVLLKRHVLRASLSELPAGIYVVNGKKMVVK